MTSPYTVLGLAPGASREEAQAAYRRLASKYHPDKHVDATPEARAQAEASFKRVKEAWETIERGDADPAAQRRGQHFQSMDDLLRQFRSAHGYGDSPFGSPGGPRQVPVISLRLPIEAAIAGARVPVTVAGRSVAYQLRPGMPPGATFADEVPGEDGRRVQVLVRLEIDAAPFVFTHTGALEVPVHVDALDVAAGAFVRAPDPAGGEIDVRVPAGFNVESRLRVKGRGYPAWLGDRAGARTDLLVRVVPTFAPPGKLDRAKLDALVAADAAARA
jgi:curved DNA-binding protein